ncbi:hypothetical protein EXW39_30350 (plasmid) [Bacillus mycoides]|uniref:hypothetical protein n=1 Tax=Bacillus mycoides TaxID=1405 RepID=UPI001C00C888|nr:hypothetical protein [Bacillus mycoides]QWH64331.1 hypothetical protein EXW39_30350 [Bacillus mycoides]
MNGNGRHDGWNHNQNMENRQMNQNHSGSCGCGCQQNQNEYNGTNNGSHSSNEYNGTNNGSHSSNEYNGTNNGSHSSNGYNGTNNGSHSSNGYNGTNNGSHSSNGYNGTNNGSYSYQENSYASNQNNQDMYMQNDMYGNHTYSNGSYYSTGYADTDDPLANLPDESKKFQRITNINSGDAFVMEASNRPIGYYLDPIGTCSRQTEIENTVTNGTATPATQEIRDTQNFIFYNTDMKDTFIIANRGNGRVLELVDTSAITGATDGTLASRAYNPNVLAQFYKRELVPGQTDQFYLITTLNGIEVGINNCHNNPTAWQKYTAYPRNRFQNNVYKFLKEAEDTEKKNVINFPTDLVVTAQPLSEPGELTSINGNLIIPRAIQGKSLIPGIIVNDPTLNSEKQIEKNPYYVLEFAETWYEATNTIINVGDAAYWSEFAGITFYDQNNMQDIMNVSIGGSLLGWGLKFGDSSNLFKRTIITGLSIAAASSNDNRMDFSESLKNYYNLTGSPMRYIKYIKAYELVLKRLDNSQVTKWTIYYDRVSSVRTFPRN